MGRSSSCTLPVGGMIMRRTYLIPAAVLVTGVLLSSCGGSSSAPSAASSGAASSSPQGATSSPSVSASATSNGIANLAPDAALQQVLAATRDVSSAHIAGQFTDGGKHFAVDIDAGASSGQGRLTIQGGRVDIRFVDNTVYFRGNRAGLLAFGTPRSAVKQAAGKWIKLPTTSDASLRALVSVHTFLTQILSHHGTLAKGRATTINGQSVYGIVDTRSGSGGTLYVATTGPALPVRLLGSKGQTLDFSNYNEPVTVTAPSGALSG